MKKQGPIIVKTIIFIIYLTSVTSVFGYDINTHQAMTRCAIKTACSSTGEVRSMNLDNFTNVDTDLGQVDYSKEILYGYGKTYLNYAAFGEKNFRQAQINFSHSGRYIDLIEAGSILEDALWPGADHIGDGRFNSHFYDPQQNGKALGFGYGQREDAVTWALYGAVLGNDPGGPRYNRYSLEKAFDYYKESFVLDLTADRRSSQAKLFVSLGHIAHLIQDMHAPAHTRDDGHGIFGDPLEEFGSGRDGFYLKKGIVFEGDYKNQIISDTKALPAINYSNYRDFFAKEASFVSENYYSKDTIYPAFTHKHALPSKDNIIETEAGPWKTYLNSTLVTPPKLAIRYDGTLYVSHIINGSEDISVLQDNARTLFPRAIASTEGFLNYFFRGRIQATATADGHGIEIKNISDPTLVASPDLTTFRAGGTFEIYYQTDTEENKFLMNHTLTRDLTVDDIDPYTITGLSDALATKTDVGAAGKIIVLFDGDIGTERGLAVAFLNKYQPWFQGVTFGTRQNYLTGSPAGYDTYMCQTRKIISETYNINGLDITLMYLAYNYNHYIIDHPDPQIASVYSSSVITVNDPLFIDLDPFQLYRTSGSSGYPIVELNTKFKIQGTRESPIPNEVSSEHYLLTNGNIVQDSRLDSFGPFIEEIMISSNLNPTPTRYKVMLFLELAYSYAIDGLGETCAETLIPVSFYSANSETLIQRVISGAYTEIWTDKGNFLELRLGHNSDDIHEIVHAFVIETLE